MSFFHFSAVRQDCVTCPRPSVDAMAAIGVFSNPVTVEEVSVCQRPILTGGTSESCAWRDRDWKRFALYHRAIALGQNGLRCARFSVVRPGPNCSIEKDVQRQMGAAPRAIHW